MVSALAAFFGYRGPNKNFEVWPLQRRKAAPTGKSPVPVTIGLLNLLLVISSASLISVHSFLILSHLAATDTAEVARDFLQRPLQVFGCSCFHPPFSRRAATTGSSTSEVCTRSPVEIAS